MVKLDKRLSINLNKKTNRAKHQFLLHFKQFSKETFSFQ